jgi:hypothetical protein
MTTTSATIAHRHPIRALVWGLFVGIGVSIYGALVFPIIALDSIPSAATKMAIVAVVVAVVMMLLTMYVLPPKKPEGLPPASGVAAAAPPAVTGESDTIPGDGVPESGHTE